MAKLRSTFREFLEEYDREYVQFLTEQGWWNPQTGGPLLMEIQSLLRLYLHHEGCLPEKHLQKSLDVSVLAGTVCETLGRIAAALDWYRIGQYKYRGGRVYSRDLSQEWPDISAREDAGRQQLESAICATRAGNHERARQLYEWAARNFGFLEREIQDWEDDEDKTHIVLWTNLSYRAYALLCLGRWAEALATAEQGYEYFRRDRHWKDKTYEPIVLYPIVQAVARYKLDPSPENRRKAIERLSPQAVASRNHVGHLWALFHLYNLRALHPDLAQPRTEELPPEERARQGAEACVKWMAEGGVVLDGTSESLKRLDETIREVFRGLEGEQKRKQALFLWGSYFGEVVRKELAGGQWRAHGKAMTEMAVDWELGEATLHLWAYRHVKAYMTGKAAKGLHVLWEETEQAYIDLGLAANLED